MSETQSPEGNRVHSLLIETCADDVLGFVSWNLSRQIRSLWAKLTFGGRSNGRKRTWLGNESPHQGSPQFSNEFDGKLTVDSSFELSHPSSPGRSFSSMNAKSLPYLCSSINACLERLIRSDPKDSILWKTCGEICNVLLRIYQLQKGCLEDILSTFRVICKFRKDFNLYNIVVQELSSHEESRIVGGLGLCFMYFDDQQINAKVQELFGQDYSSRIRVRAFEAYSEILSEKRKDRITFKLGDLQVLFEMTKILIDKTNINDEDDIFERINLVLDSLLLYLSQIDYFILEVDGVMIDFIGSFVSRYGSLSCSQIITPALKSPIALKSLLLISKSSVFLSHSQVQLVFGSKYEDFGLIFDVVNETVSPTKGAIGLVTLQTRKLASDVLTLIFPNAADFE